MLSILITQTTLLDVIAGYKTGGTITGDILIDGRPKEESTWRKIPGYAEVSQNLCTDMYLFYFVHMICTFSFTDILSPSL